INFRKDILSLISLSIGIVLSQPLSENIDEILAKCDSAMYISKTSGKNRYTVFHANDKTLRLTHDIENDMQSALDNKDFKLYLHPQMNLVTSKVAAAEAVSRWELPDGSVRSPELYIPIFEKNGFITKLDMYIYEEVCRLKKTWKTSGSELANLPVSINFSRLHLYFPDFPGTLLRIASKYRIPTSELLLEFKENTFIKDTSELNNNVERLQKIGFRVAIDEFGAGVSALNLFKEMNVDILKIDRNFFKDSSASPRGRIVLRNIINLARDLRIDVVTSGVTDQDQVDFLVHCGCQIAQGFLFSEPMAIPEFEKFSNGRISAGDICYSFPLDGDYNSEDGSLTAIPHGNLKFIDGIFTGHKALSLPGGEVREAYLELPTSIIHDDSYTIAFWLRPYDLSLWKSAFFIRFEHGFASFNPFAWEGHCAFRTHDSRLVAKWDDNGACMLREDMWWHIAITYNAVTTTSIIYVNAMPLSIHDDHTPLRYVEEIIFGGDDFQQCLKCDLCNIRIYNESKDIDFITRLHEDEINREDFAAGPLRALV
ncbi:MAG: EAL domain-containing protein, partial [Lachnospiraceae bacterium]|nr:EAL domain-containing protein [Lachnospiraceae bacterium]